MFQTIDFGNVFAFVAFDSLDDDFGGGAFFCVSGFSCLGFGCFLLGVFFGALLGVDAQGGEVLGESFGGVEFRV